MNLDWFTIYSEAHSYQIKNQKILYIAIDAEKPGEIHWIQIQAFRWIWIRSGISKAWKTGY
jgi:hypothetical protein